MRLVCGLSVLFYYDSEGREDVMQSLMSFSDGDNVGGKESNN